MYDLPLAVIRTPTRALEALVYDIQYKLLYMICLLLPTGLLPLLSPFELLPTLPWIVVSLLSNYKPYYSFGCQYSAFLIGFIYIAAARGLGKLMVSHQYARPSPLDPVLNPIRGIESGPVSSVNGGLLDGIPSGELKGVLVGPDLSHEAYPNPIRGIERGAKLVVSRIA